MMAKRQQKPVPGSPAARPDIRQAARPDIRQAARPDISPAERPDIRPAGSPDIRTMAGGMSLARLKAATAGTVAGLLARPSSPSSSLQPGRAAGHQTAPAASPVQQTSAASLAQQTARPQTAGGFSLVELLTIVSIIGVLAFVAMPVYTGYKKETVRKELLKRAETFFASATLCLMDSESALSGCNTKLKLGYYCPSGCEGPKEGKLGAGATNDTLSLQFTIEGVSGCVSHFTGVCHVDSTGKPKHPLVHCPGTACAATGETCMPYKNFRAKGVCNNSGQAVFPIKFCASDSDCSSATCSTKDGKLDTSSGKCIDAT